MKRGIQYSDRKYVIGFMNNKEFWNSINAIIADGFTPEGLQKLDYYAELFENGRLVYQRFSPFEQHGCAAGGATHVIASLLAGAEVAANRDTAPDVIGFKREIQRGTKQAEYIERWARVVGCWTERIDDSLPRLLGEKIAEGGEAVVYDHGQTLVKAIGLDYFIQPILALDRISLHNAYFPETSLLVLGFGRTADGLFKIIVEQPFIEGSHVSDEEIAKYLNKLGFELRNPCNWTYATPEIYLSDLHDENVIISKEGNIFVIDCDIRINTPALRQGGVRVLTTKVEIL